MWFTVLLQCCVIMNGDDAREYKLLPSPDNV